MRYRCPKCKTVTEVNSAGALCQCGYEIGMPGYLSTGVVYGEFELKEILTKRSNETVFWGEQIPLERRVIVKVLNKETVASKGFEDAYMQAGKNAAQISHPFLCNIITIGNDNGTIFLVSEAGGKRTLNDLLVNQGLLKWQGAAEYICDIAKALAFSWKEARLRHLNIKPDFVLIDVHDHARLIDIGLPGISSEGNSERIVGTPQYIAPERIVGLGGDHRSDLYSLGVMFFFMITGQFPFKVSSSSEFIDKHLNEEPQKANTLIHEIPAELSAIIDKLLEKDPNKRFADGLALVADIQSVLVGQGAPVTPSSSPLLIRVANDSETFVSVTKGESPLPLKVRLDHDNEAAKGISRIVTSRESIAALEQTVGKTDDPLVPPPEECTSTDDDSIAIVSAASVSSELDELFSQFDLGEEDAVSEGSGDSVNCHQLEGSELTDIPLMNRL